jgi:hypothetical protein
MARAACMPASAQYACAPSAGASDALGSAQHIRHSHQQICGYCVSQCASENLSEDSLGHKRKEEYYWHVADIASCMKMIIALQLACTP